MAKIFASKPPLVWFCQAIDLGFKDCDEGTFGRCSAVAAIDAIQFGTFRTALVVIGAGGPFPKFNMPFQ